MEHQGVLRVVRFTPWCDKAGCSWTGPDYGDRPQAEDTLRRHNATQHPPKHVLSMGRTSLGTSATGGRAYGTAGHCQGEGCGWKFRINEAPSRGGNRAVGKAFEEHLAEVEPE